MGKERIYHCATCHKEMYDLWQESALVRIDPGSGYGGKRHRICNACNAVLKDAVRDRRITEERESGRVFCVTVFKNGVASVVGDYTPTEINDGVGAGVLPMPVGSMLDLYRDALGWASVCRVTVDAEPDATDFSQIVMERVGPNPWRGKKTTEV